MRNVIDINDATKLISSAFAPMRCVAESYDYDHLVRFRVFNASDEALLTWENIQRPQFLDSTGLNSLITSARDKLMNRAIVLDPWNFPI